MAHLLWHGRNSALWGLLVHMPVACCTPQACRQRSHVHITMAGATDQDSKCPLDTSPNNAFRASAMPTWLRRPPPAAMISDAHGTRELAIDNNVSKQILTVNKTNTRRPGSKYMFNLEASAQSVVCGAKAVSLFRSFGHTIRTHCPAELANNKHRPHILPPSDDTHQARWRSHNQRESSLPIAGRTPPCTRPGCCQRSATGA